MLVKVYSEYERGKPLFRRTYARPYAKQTPFSHNIYRLNLMSANRVVQIVVFQSIWRYVLLIRYFSLSLSLFSMTIDPATTRLNLSFVSTRLPTLFRRNFNKFKCDRCNKHSSNNNSNQAVVGAGFLNIYFNNNDKKDM
jgi:hypothetical protein